MKTCPRLAIILAGLIGCCAAVYGADTQPPTIQTVSPTPGVIGALTQITVTFSEPVTGISFEDLLVNGAATAIGMSGSNAVYTFTLEAQPLYGAVQISWDANHHIFDLAVPPNRFDQTSLGASWQYTLVDTTAPVVTTLTPVAVVTARL